MQLHARSKRDPDARRLAWEAQRRAEAMGLMRPAADAGFDLAALRKLARTVGGAGIGRAPSRELANVERPDAEELAGLLQLLIRALEDSPAPSFEWPALSSVFEPDQLADLLQISVSSLKRYAAGTRVTPDAVAARLHFLALVSGDLAGSYNEIGVRRWFGRPRSALAGKTPAALLTGEWAPEDRGPRQVRELARSLVTLSGT